MIAVETGFDKVTKSRQNDGSPGVCGLLLPSSSAGVNRNGWDPKCSGGDYEDLGLVKGGAGISVSRLEGPPEVNIRLNVLEDTSTCSNAAISTGTMEAPHPYSALDQTSCIKVSFSCPFQRLTDVDEYEFTVLCVQFLTARNFMCVLSICCLATYSIFCTCISIRMSILYTG